MFFVFNRRKISSYMVAVSTVAVLLIFASVSNKKITNTISTSSNIANSPICEMETENNEVAITINCINEKNEDIDSIMNSLLKAKIKATFFVTGKFAESNKELIKKISNNGFEIGNLSNNYENLTKLSIKDIKDNIEQANEAIKNLTGKSPMFFRMPYGQYDENVIKAVDEEKMKLIGWSVDSLDYNGFTIDEINERIDETIKCGGIILFDSGSTYKEEGLEKIINEINKKGYKIIDLKSKV